jgi:hypothetical protein
MRVCVVGDVATMDATMKYDDFAGLASVHVELDAVDTGLGALAKCCQ